MPGATLMSGEGKHSKYILTMDSSLVLQGMIIGLILAVPVGPLSLMCIQRSLSEGKLHGIVSGLGVATADTFYAAVTFLGLTVVSGLLLSWQTPLRIIAGLVLIVVGVRIFLSRPAAKQTSGPAESYTKNYVTMVAITLANPMTIIFLMVTLPGFGFVLGGTTLGAAAEFIGGFLFGSVAWWIVLCGFVGSVRSRISLDSLTLINRVSGTYIVCVGIFMLASIFYTPF